MSPIPGLSRGSFVQHRYYCVMSRHPVQPHESFHCRHLGIQRGTFAL